jgi:hypothetical protein
MFGEAWVHFARAVEALVRIRDKELYKNEHESFDVYCQKRWGFGSCTALRYISAAQVHSTLATVPDIPMPECEAQVRPLIGLPAELAQQAWLNALSWSRDGHVPAQMVKRAVNQARRRAGPSLCNRPLLGMARRN